MLPPRCKIYPLDQTEVAELKKQIIELSKENKMQVSDSPYGAPILFIKKRMDNYVYAFIAWRLLKPCISTQW